jgi:hypothetical protein
MLLAASRAVRNTPLPVALTLPSEPAEFNGFAGDDAGDGATLVRRVGVHHPGHDLRIRVDVGSGDILGRADDDADLAGVAARDFFELVQGQALGVDPDAAFGAAVGDVHCGVLDRHPGGERQDFLQGHVGVVAHAAFAGPAREVVLDTVAFEMRDFAGVHLDGDIDDQRPLGMLECLHPPCQLAEVGRHLVDLRQVRVPGAARRRIEIRERSHQGMLLRVASGHVSLTGLRPGHTGR